MDNHCLYCNEVIPDNERVCDSWECVNMFNDEFELEKPKVELPKGGIESWEDFWKRIMSEKTDEVVKSETSGECVLWYFLGPIGKGTKEECERLMQSLILGGTKHRFKVITLEEYEEIRKQVDR